MIRLSTALLSVALLSGCRGAPIDTSTSPAQCDADPVASGQIVQIDPWGSLPCSFALGQTEFIRDQETWDYFASRCLDPTVAEAVPPLDFDRQEVVVRTQLTDCPNNYTIPTPSCEDGVLTAHLQYTPSWCSCSYIDSAPVAFIAPKGMITELHASWESLGQCGAVTCECGGDIGTRNGCVGCPGI